jgi:hypothetical protein
MKIDSQGEQTRDDGSVIHQGRWKKTERKQADRLGHYNTDPLSVWEDSPMSHLLTRQVSSNTALCQQYQYIFLNHHFPEEMLAPNRPKQFVSTNWLLNLQNLELKSAALETSVAAFFAGRVGRLHNDENLVRQSHGMYVASLEHLRLALSNPTTRLADETLAAVEALSFYELSESPPGVIPSAYIAHQQGALKLLELRGPAACTTPLGHSLFLEIRTQAVRFSLDYTYIANAMLSNPKILRNMYTRRDTFLARPEWRSTPWAANKKASYDEVMDTFFDTLTIFQSFDKACCIEDASERRVSLCQILTSCFELQSRLKSLYDKFDKSVPGPLYWPQLSNLKSNLDDENLGKVFPISFYFPAFFVSQVVCGYWSAMMTLHYQLMQTYQKLAEIELPAESPQDDHSSIASAAERSEEHAKLRETIARNLCQAVEYGLQDNMGGLGPLAAMTQIAGCLSCMHVRPENFTREMMWIMEMISRIKDKMSLAFLK